VRESLRLFLIGGTMLSCLVIADLASSQPAPPTPPGPGAAPQPPPQGPPAYNLQQLPETRGTVQRFTLTPRGELDGFLLADGTQVHLPPHLSDQLAAAVRIGDPVSVRGYRSPTVPLVVASAMTDSLTNRTVVDQGPPPPGTMPPPLPPGTPSPGAQQASVSGRVQASLYGPAGDLNGAVLSEGTNIRMGPAEASQFSNLLTPGQTITAQGWALNTAYGQVVDAQTVSPVSAPTATPQPPPRSSVPAAPPPR
jgi:hypothetical protein